MSRPSGQLVGFWSFANATENLHYIYSEINSFPAPADVLKLDVAQLRTAGLSGRKAEYGASLSRQIDRKVG